MHVTMCVLLTSQDPERLYSVDPSTRSTKLNMHTTVHIITFFIAFMSS